MEIEIFVVQEQELLSYKLSQHWQQSVIEPNRKIKN